ncbi:AAA family ATPase [Plectonema cf. radiosum LEGE 06105]|uniref:AAA family ATPase n=1 Tax=Plectonema cf. radiosum LEGE 06105 TaxID=945769 RepID=A0A8J7F695_9CYAN|nr:ATP-binding protein [Plectonema radiosum]MBE9216388.1 AAA family ATPase [Plectonema cf. radiosum LEGE 06105]
MFKNIKIENFRCFKSFELQQLGRINLLVGENNSGKTSILEAVQLLCSRTNFEPLSKIMANRSEYVRDDDDDSRGIGLLLDVKHLFYGHEIEPESQFSISGINDNEEEKMTVSIRTRDLNPRNNHIGESNQEFPGFDESLIELRELNFSVIWTYQDKQEISTLPLSINGGLALIRTRQYRQNPNKKVVRTQFVTSSSLNSKQMIELFDEVVLTPEEKLITEALQTIEPKIERIASVTSNKFRNSELKTGFVVLLSDSTQRLPIGSMGDGMWRILGLALAIVCAKDGVLFVDEIDTGLHFTAMSDMWKLIWKTAKRLNVQVFATTHSSDCWTSLASIAREEDAAEDGITIQRIEKDKNTAVSFNEREIVIAAEREIEVR